jgi:hypothetical protein
MSLPVVKVNKYNQEIKELGKTIKYRPFLQGEHKILLTAIEFKDESALVNALIDIVKACTFDELDMDKLPMHLVDYIFLKIYTKSVGAKTPTVYHCTHLTNKGEEGKVNLQPCNSKFNMHINLEDAELFYPEGYEAKKIIMVDDAVGIKLRAPSFEDYRKIDLEGSFVDITDQFVLSCIESVFDAETVRVPGVDFTPAEMIAWMDKLESHVADDIGTFFQDLPYLGLTVNVKCPECGNKEVIELKGLEDFFV